MRRHLERLLGRNRSAVASFQSAALAIPADAWHSPIATGKWSAAQHVEHIARAYDAAVRDLVDGAPMRLIGTPRQRRLWRLLGLSAVRFLRRLPRGAPAPREIRPIGDSARSRTSLLAELDEHVRAFEVAVESNAANRSRGFVHPYFGGLSMTDGLRVAIVHTRHHERALREMLAHSTGR